jgi:hypothetical protein
VLQLSIGSDFSSDRIRELQHQIQDYTSLIADPVCPLEMRDVLALEMAQIVASLLILCEQIDCALTVS